MIKTWLWQCRIDHRDICPDEQESNSFERPVLQRLRVIDCRTKQVVLKPLSGIYVALSYVWGRTSEDSEYPRVVEDSLILCLALGYQYLWVDRYCINQNDVKDKHEQIAAMDLIYGCADLVIIAAAGDGAHCGLPGVAGEARKPQRHIQIGSVRLIETFDTRRKLRETVWWTRGWTFQEGLLARRKLIFTEQEVYFQCRCSYFFEAFQIPKVMGPIPVPQSSESSENNPADPLLPLTGFIPDDCSIGRLEDYIIQYTKKKLSFESDRLTAFMGVLNAFQKPHIWGIPILLDVDQWYGSSFNVIFLGWRSFESAQRRHGFPSWSWTSWDTEVENIGLGAWSYCFDYKLPTTAAKDEAGNDIRYLEISIEVGSTAPPHDQAKPPQPISLREFVRDFANGIDYTRTSSVLEIEAPTILVKLKKVSIPPENARRHMFQEYWYVELPISDQEAARFQMATTDKDHVVDPEETYLAVVISSADFEHHMLILARRLDLYERIGLLELNSYFEMDSQLPQSEINTHSSADGNRSWPVWARDTKRRKFRLG
ncbi:heterokaryon incompatibility protein-domain-containing protein [Hypoxylon sp. FL1284]|nr:heterokaryon incompatibility protein-domain-containing protein [Hypoxylon sp. FL1284]